MFIFCQVLILLFRGDHCVGDFLSCTYLTVGGVKPWKCICTIAAEQFRIICTWVRNKGANSAFALAVYFLGSKGCQLYNIMFFTRILQAYKAPTKDMLALRSQSRMFKRLQFKRLAAVSAISFRDVSCHRKPCILITFDVSNARFSTLTFKTRSKASWIVKPK